MVKYREKWVGWRCAPNSLRKEKSMATEKNKRKLHKSPDGKSLQLTVSSGLMIIFR